ncbi:MAG: glycosyltransferase [Candidatus Cloacimonetes bacterium]|nr:glycosyltransferase [Candidatus Cloacimonadota bacterium]
MQKIKIACIGNYIPRQCGIATFTRDFIDSITNKKKDKNIHVDAFVVAINDHDQTYDYPEIVEYTIRQDYQIDYIKAAHFINYSDADICILQHEFGIFGGENGIYILSLIHRLKIPLIVTFHTVLKNPSYTQKEIVRGISKKTEKIVVMSKLAIDFLTKIYNVPREKLAIIEHGVPDLNFIRSEQYKKKFHLEDKKSLFTFGLLSKNKGIETVIQALPKVVEKHPEVIYIILGKTHPNVLRESGEEYRNYLQLLVEKNNLRKYVYFNNHFVSNKELFSYLSAIDIYITPYLNEGQITSGTLSYAVGAGAAVISTPYWHAQELLADGRGKLFNFGSSDELADILNELLDKPSELLELRKKAYCYGQKNIWSEIGTKYLKLISTAIRSYTKIIIQKEAIIDPLVLPPYCLIHIERLTDNTGIFQHANYIVPNLKDGYCLDDNARALLMVSMAYREKRDPVALKLLQVYLGFIHYMQNENGTFRNFLSFNRDFLDEIGSEDSFGRTIWALGYLIRFAHNEAYFLIAKEMFDLASPNFEKLQSIRGIANTLGGLYHYLKRFPDDEGLQQVLKKITNMIINSYLNNKDKKWHWFEPILAYDNGIIPLSLFYAYKITGDKKTLGIAQESMKFLEKVVIKNGYLSLVGADNWFKKGEERSQYPQQPIDAIGMVLMFYQAYNVTKDKNYLKKMFRSYMWFLGDNDLRISLYDFATCGCCDGLESCGVNRNQGAESNIAYKIALLTVLSAHEHEIRGH